MASNKYYLGDLIKQRREKNPGGDLPIRGVSKDGLQPPKQIDADTSIYNVYYRNDFIFNPARMELGSIAFNNEYDKAICSSLYEVFYVYRTDLVIPEYLALFVKHPEFARYCNYIGNGSAREYCRFDNISEIPIVLPSLPEQRKIVHDYQVITDRIELLRKMNENLEEQAELLFSDFMSSSNGIEGVFSDVIKIMGGGTPSTAVNEYWNGDIPFFTPGDINGSFCFSTDKTLTDKGLANCSSKKYPIKTTFITCRGTVGKVALAGVPMAMNQTCYALTGKGDYPDYFVYEFVKYFVNSIKRKANGGVFDAITTKDFETEKVDVPTEGQALDFEKDAEPIFAVIFNNQREMFTLEHIRTLTMTSMIQKGA